MQLLANKARDLSQLVSNVLMSNRGDTFQLSEDASKRIRRSQIRGAIEQMRIFVVGNTFFAPVLSFQAWNAGVNAMVVGWCVVMLSFSWWLFFRWRTSYQTDGRLSHMQAFVAETRLNSALWCLGMVLFFPYVEGDAKTILITVLAGSLALGTFGFSQAPIAAFWYLAIQATVLTTVPIGFGIYRGSGSDILVGVLSLVASAALFNAVLERSRAQLKAFINHEELAQKSEVIDLLLKDYEEQGIEWLWQTDARGRLMNGPKQVLDMLKVDLSQPTPVNLMHAIQDAVGPEGLKDLARAQDAFLKQSDFHDVTLPFYDQQDEKPRWIMMRGRPQFDDGIFIGFRGIFADATTTFEAKRQVEHLADHDSLTGTYNRNAVQRRLEDLDPKRDQTIVYLIDLDGFKQVNDSYGHAIGDELLRIMANRLSTVVHPDDLVARLGGDEFIVVSDLSALPHPFDHDAYADRILKTLAEPYLIKQLDIALSASIGTARFPDDTKVGTNLLIQADLALYVAKQSGRNRCCPFVNRM